MPFWTDDLCKPKGKNMSEDIPVTVDTWGRVKYSPEVDRLLSTIEFMLQEHDTSSDPDCSLNPETLRAAIKPFTPEWSGKEAELNAYESQVNPYRPHPDPETLKLALLYASDAPEFIELMAAIDAMTQAEHFGDSPARRRLIEAKAALMAKVPK